MCIFTKDVTVYDTAIFARVEASKQFIAYQMSISAQEDTAMILPIPVALSADEQVVEFISLEQYPEFFYDLDRPFSVFTLLERFPVKSFSPLAVQRVGAYDASFVPTIADFDRLDRRFRLPAQVWSNLPGYEDFGFAVFKLAGGRSIDVHPMAFSFPTRLKGAVFFPTVHIHDGLVAPEADFDHTLYCQGDGKRLPRESEGWMRASTRMREWVDIHRAKDIVEPNFDYAMTMLAGRRDNQDFVADLGNGASEKNVVTP